MKNVTTKRRGILVALNSGLRRLGLCVIPVSEIVNMEEEAAANCESMKRPDISPRDKGYFNGLADYASKTADRLRCHYLLNKLPVIVGGSFIVCILAACLGS